MENFCHQLSSQGKTLHTDASPATRLSQRPPRREQGATHEDLGSDFRKPSSSRPRAFSRTHSKGSTSASLRASSVVSIDDDDSPDEIDFLTTPSESTQRKSSSRRKREMSATSVDDKPFPLDHHQTNPNYKILDLTKMKIPKKSSVASSIIHTPENSQATIMKGSNSGPSSSSLADPTPPTNSYGTAPEGLQTNSQRKSPLREHSPNQRRRGTRHPSTPPGECKSKDNVKRGKEDVDSTPRPTRPAPRPVNKGKGKSKTVPDFESQDREEKNQSRCRSQTLEEYPGGGLSPLKGDGDSDDPRVSSARTRATKKAGKSKAKTEFTVSPNACSSSDDESGDHSRVNKKRKGKVNRTADPISDLSPLCSPQHPKHRRDRTKFPDLSPLRSPVSHQSSTILTCTKVRKLASQRRTIMSSDDDSDVLSSRALCPFPMETQVLASIRSTPAFSRRAVRTSSGEGSSGSNGNKQRKEAMKLPLGSDSDSDSDDDIFLDPNVDPRTLCPWCDEPLPSEPTSHLHELISSAKRISRPDDRPSNPLGLRAPLAAFVGVCQRHRFERNWVPLARRKGWPTSIEWDKLTGRINDLKDTFQAIVTDVDEEFAPHVATPGSSGTTRARKSNEFWMEVVMNVREQGSAQTTGVRGQFMHFNKSQPGYYGELGYMIIHQTLCDLFPPASFHPDATLPLTPADFISSILVPEAAVGLIIEDLDLPRDRAIETLRESVEYGVAMFPVDEGEGEGVFTKKHGKTVVKGLGAGERMFMERARVRRKELEEEERLEKEEARRSAIASKPRPRPRPRGKAPSSGVQTDAESVGLPSSSSPGPPSERSGSKRKKARVVPRGRSRSASAPGSAATTANEAVIELSSDTGSSNATGPSPSKRRKRGTASGICSDIEMDAGMIEDIAGSSTAEATPKPKPAKTKPRSQAQTRRTVSRSRTASDHSDHDAPEEVVQASQSSTSLSASVPFVSFSRTGKLTVNGAADATPRPKGKVQKLEIFPSSSALTSTSSPPENGASVTPLQIAIERFRGKKGSQASGSRLTDANLRTNNTVESTDEDEQYIASSSSGQGSRFGNRGQDRGSWTWLLSDSSQPRSEK